MSSLCCHHNLDGRLKDHGKPQDEVRLHGGLLPGPGGLQVVHVLVRGASGLPFYYAPYSIVEGGAVWQGGRPHVGWSKGFQAAPVLLGDELLAPVKPGLFGSLREELKVPTEVAFKAQSLHHVLGGAEGHHEPPGHGQH